jgi:hypothetical protein
LADQVGYQLQTEQILATMFKVGGQAGPRVAMA